MSAGWVLAAAGAGGKHRRQGGVAIQPLQQPIRRQRNRQRAKTPYVGNQPTTTRHQHLIR
jgi:hypothetical protein